MRRMRDRPDVGFWPFGESCAVPSESLMRVKSDISARLVVASIARSALGPKRLHRSSCSWHPMKLAC